MTPNDRDEAMTSCTLGRITRARTTTASPDVDAKAWLLPVCLAPIVQ